MEEPYSFLFLFFKSLISQYTRCYVTFQHILVKREKVDIYYAADMAWRRIYVTIKSIAPIDESYFSSLRILFPT